MRRAISKRLNKNGDITLTCQITKKNFLGKEYITTESYVSKVEYPRWRSNGEILVNSILSSELDKLSKEFPPEAVGVDKEKNKFKVITLCGSTKFKDEFIEANKWLTLQGNIVISVGLFGHADGDNITPEEKISLDKLHRGKIDLCDEIFVINVDGYIGESTKGEIDYAIDNEKDIKFWSDEKSKISSWKYDYDKRKPQDWNKNRVIPTVPKEERF